MRGKEKCRMLREIRQQIAMENDIALVTEECTHKGECRGTCPRCEAEVRYLEKQLEARQSLGKRIAICGIAAGTAIAMSGCALDDAAEGIVRAVKDIKQCISPSDDPMIYETGEIDVMGDVPYYMEAGDE